MTRKSMCCVIAIALMACAAGAFAQDFPSQPIRIIVPYTAGGSSDFVARTVGAKMQESLNSAVVVENRPGAGSSACGSCRGRDQDRGSHARHDHSL